MSERTALIRKALDFFGEAKNPADAGYILPDGRLLDFGRDFPTAKMEHYQVQQLYPNLVLRSRFDYINRFEADTGAARIQVNPYERQLGIEIVNPLTESQVDTLDGLIADYDLQETRLDISTPEGTILSSIEDSTPHPAIQKAIQYFRRRTK